MNSLIVRLIVKYDISLNTYIDPFYTSNNLYYGRF